jgi:hypothetical protein
VFENTRQSSQNAALVEKWPHRKGYAEILDLIAELDTTRVAEQAGYPSLPAFLNHLLHELDPRHVDAVADTIAQLGFTEISAGRVAQAGCLGVPACPFSPPVLVEFPGGAGVVAPSLAVRV